MPSFLEPVMDFFTVNDQTTAVVIWVFLGVALFCLILRIIICAGYQTQFAVFSFSAKELKTKDDVKNLKSGLIGKVTRAYVKSCEKGIGHIDTEAIVDKEVLKLGFLFWKYESMAGFVKSFETSIILMGLLLAFALEYRQVLVVLSLSVFIILRVFAAFFDFELSVRRLRDEVIEYIDREIGQFYIVDLSTSIVCLKSEMVESTARQSESLNASIQKLGGDLAGVLRLAVGDMSKSVEETIRVITGYSDVLQKPMEEWKNALDMAAAVQTRINTAVESMEKTVDALGTVSSSLREVFDAHNSIVTERSQSLVKASEGIRESNLSIEVHSEALKKAMDYIQENQAVLRESVNSFELTMEGLTTRLGDGMASIIEYTMQRSYKTLNENLSENIRGIIQSNNEFIYRLQKLFDAYQEQSRSEAQAIVQMKEQIDIQFEALTEKLQ